jgi:hypothetical protein
MNKGWLILIFGIILSSYVSALACVGLGGGGYTVLTSKEQPTYITYTIFNKDSKGVCDSGRYSLELTLDSEDIYKVFDFVISDDGFILNDGESKKVLITLIPLVEDGNYTLKVSALRAGLIETQNATAVMPKTISSIKINVNEEYNSKFTDLPKWYILKQKERKQFIFKIVILSIIIIVIIFVILYLVLFRFKKIKSIRKSTSYKYK